jgi:hypothetical protein
VEQAPSLRHTTEVVAAYVVCGGRMHLYAHPHNLGERALYCDTESVKFVQNTDELHLIERGDALRDMTFKLKGKE